MPKAPLHPVPKFHGYPKSMNKLTLNEPAIISGRALLGLIIKKKVVGFSTSIGGVSFEKLVLAILGTCSVS